MVPPPEQVPRPKLPSEALRQFLWSDRNLSVKYIPSLGHFKYMPDPLVDRWDRIYGLTAMLRHAFWSDYDRNAPVIQAGVKQAKRYYYAKRKEQLALRGAQQPRRKGGGMTTAEIVRLAQQEAQEKRGTELGELVHTQLNVWAFDRFLGTKQFGKAKAVAWPANFRTLAIIRRLTQDLGVDVRYGEFVVYDERVPVATAVDLVGWSPSRRAVVLIEVKTGSKWNLEMGSGPMHGRTPRAMKLNNSPLHQALVQLAVTRSIVEQMYGVQRLEALLIWANRWPGTEPGTHHTVVTPRWLNDPWKQAGDHLLTDLYQHMKARGGKAWAKPKAGTHQG